ncbi:nuclease domain-containing protein [Paraburkholderia caledonica]|uniref:nuclease domain-containing protein n=1 Tax=Paraburkholderia caledonica TaxID=134536 RepID=UPI0038BA3295
MNRSTPMKRGKPLARTGFKRKEPGAFKAQLDRNTQTLVRSTFKRKARKPKAGDDKRMRDACRDEPCYLRIPGVCTSDPRKSVPAHRNEGKGMGLKTADVFTVPACPTCHSEYDQGKRFLREHKRALWNAAYTRWQPVRAAKMGLEMQEAA